MSTVTKKPSYTGPKWEAKRKRFESNAKYRVLKEKLKNLEAAARAELVAELLKEMGPRNARFLGHLLGVDDKTIGNDLRAAAQHPSTEHQNKAPISEFPTAANQSQPATASSEVDASPVEREDTIAISQDGSHLRPNSHSSRNEYLGSLRVQPDPRERELQRLMAEAQQDRKRIHQLGASGLASSDHPRSKG